MKISTCSFSLFFVGQTMLLSSFLIHLQISTMEVSQGLKTIFSAVLVLNKFEYISKCSIQFKNFIIWR